jgi:DNA-binding MarR family transcriptional regulator
LTPRYTVARALDISEAGATGIVPRMEERGILKRAGGAADRHVVTVPIAAAGERAFVKLDGLTEEGPPR